MLAQRRVAFKFTFPNHALSAALREIPEQHVHVGQPEHSQNFCQIFPSANANSLPQKLVQERLELECKRVRG